MASIPLGQMAQMNAGFQTDPNCIRPVTATDELLQMLRDVSSVLGDTQVNLANLDSRLFCPPPESSGKDGPSPPSPHWVMGALSEAAQRLHIQALSLRAVSQSLDSRI